MKIDKLSKGPILDAIKERSGGLKVANDIKDSIVLYLEQKLDEEINCICNWAQKLAKLQGKRTILERDWEFLLEILQEK